MPKIALLPKTVSELIAAGEVVERPASVIKEMVENAIDAKSTVITVEIQRGGITYIRVTDNGCGIDMEDVPTAFLRHATSKIKKGSDLDQIATLGFRGEALAAISSVSRMEMLTRTADSEEGTHFVIEGGEQKLCEIAGCPAGTTIIVRDIFYNTPARMKFLKKDVSEANACSAVVERIALSHPEISFKLIRDGKVSLSTSGDGELKNCVYSVLGREFTNALIPVDYELNGVKVTGLTCKPVFCRPTRSGQYTFLNGRLVRSGTVIAAVEQAYKNSAMVGKFPGFTIYLTIPFDTVDVNVHPAKTEVRFSDEKRIFDAVYAAVKNAITVSDTRPQVKLTTPTFNPYENKPVAEYTQQRIVDEKTVAEKIYATKPKAEYQHTSSVFRNNTTPDFVNRYSVVGEKGERVLPQTAPTATDKPKQEIPDLIKTQVLPKRPLVDVNISVDDEPKVIAEPIIEEQETETVILIGEAFSTYIVVQKGESIFMIDKHAAHERILFNDLKANQKPQIQALLSPITATLSFEEYDALTNNISLLEESGFEIEDFGNSSVIVRALPAFLTDENVPSLISEIAQNLITNKSVSSQKAENVFHTVACKAAIKAGSITSREEMLSLAKKVLYSEDIMYCPHGRPVAFEIKKRELEKQFGRIQ